MHSIGSSFTHIALLQKQLKRAQASIRVKQAALDTAFAELRLPLQSICRKAIAHYNAHAEAGGYLVDDTMRLDVDQDKMTVSLFVQLRYQDGCEPHDTWDFTEDLSYNQAFAPVVNQLLAEAAIPLTFGSLSFPPSYYMK